MFTLVYSTFEDPIWLTYLNCDNNDEILDDCYLGTLGNPYYGCGHYEDVGVICRPGECIYNNPVCTDYNVHGC